MPRMHLLLQSLHVHIQTYKSHDPYKPFNLPTYNSYNPYNPYTTTTVQPTNTTVQATNLSYNQWAGCGQVWHDTRIWWLIHHMQDMTHSYVRHGSLICVAWIIHMRHDSLICVTWLVHIYDMIHSYVWLSFICATSLTQVNGPFHYALGVHENDIYVESQNTSTPGSTSRNASGVYGTNTKVVRSQEPLGSTVCCSVLRCSVMGVWESNLVSADGRSAKMVNWMGPMEKPPHNIYNEAKGLGFRV